MQQRLVPVLLVTGFLGAGKTTFLNWLIHTHSNLKISLILNEFGDVKLESQFIKQDSGGEVVELSNGCMCCVAKSDIPRIINYILDQSPETQYILIEASGLSDPDPIYEILHSPTLESRIDLRGIISIVDALNFEKTRTEHPIVMSQIGDANIVLISKVKEAGPETVTRVHDFITNLAEGVNVLEFSDTLDPHLFLDTGPNVDSMPKEEESPSPESGEGDLVVGDTDSKPHHHEHEQMTEYWFKSPSCINLDKLRQVFAGLPIGIVRAKGLINTVSGKYLVQYVGQNLEISPDVWEKEETPSTALLFLGTGFDQSALQSDLSSCLEQG